MKRKDLERKLKQAGWVKTEGGNHTKWKKDGMTIPTPRHNEVNECLAKAILKQAGID